MNGIEVSRVAAAYGKTEVLHDVSMSVARGSWVGLIGPNGAGKSTLLRTLAGLVAHTGTIDVDGVPLRSLGRRELARRVALVPQNPMTPADMRVADYVALGRAPYIPYFGVESADDLRTASEIMAGLELSSFAERTLGSLSGGELQRAVLARALTQGAPVLLLDEPTAALDVGRQGDVLELVESMRARKGLTVMSAMHDLTLAAQFCDRLVLLRDGRVVASGMAQEVLRAAVVEAHFGARVRVIEHPDGGVVVAPARTDRSDRRIAGSA